MSSAATYERDGHVATITYNRPDALNAVNGAMREALDECWTTFREDDEAWVAIVTGAGRAFCAGADLRDGEGSTGTWPGSFWEWPTITTFESGMEIWKPTIAAVNGPCVGYGLTAVLACDFVLASDRATFSYPEVGIGVSTIVGALRLLDVTAVATTRGAATKHELPKSFDIGVRGDILLVRNAEDSSPMPLTLKEYRAWLKEGGLAAENKAWEEAAEEEAGDDEAVRREAIGGDGEAAHVDVLGDDARDAPGGHGDGRPDQAEAVDGFLGVDLGVGHRSTLPAFDARPDER